MSEDDDEAGEDPEVAARRLEAESLARLSGLSLEQVIQAGHEAMLRLLVAKVRAGTIKHQEAAILRNMLRDNGMMLNLPKTIEAQPLALPQGDLEDLPRLGKPEYLEGTD